MNVCAESIVHLSTHVKVKQLNLVIKYLSRYLHSYDDINLYSRQ